MSLQKQESEHVLTTGIFKWHSVWWKCASNLHESYDRDKILGKINISPPRYGVKWLSVCLVVCCVCSVSQQMRIFCTNSGHSEGKSFVLTLLGEVPTEMHSIPQRFRCDTCPTLESNRGKKCASCVKQKQTFYTSTSEYQQADWDQFHPNLIFSWDPRLFSAQPFSALLICLGRKVKEMCSSLGQHKIKYSLQVGSWK